MAEPFTIATAQNRLATARSDANLPSCPLPSNIGTKRTGRLLLCLSSHCRRSRMGGTRFLNRTSASGSSRGLWAFISMHSATFPVAKSMSGASGSANISTSIWRGSSCLPRRRDPARVWFYLRLCRSASLPDGSISTGVCYAGAHSIKLRQRGASRHQGLVTGSWRFCRRWKRIDGEQRARHIAAEQAFGAEEVEAMLARERNEDGGIQAVWPAIRFGGSH